MAFAFLSEFAHDLREDKLKMDRVEAYIRSVKNFLTEHVVN